MYSVAQDIGTHSEHHIRPMQNYRHCRGAARWKNVCMRCRMHANSTPVTCRNVASKLSCGKLHMALVSACKPL